MLRQAIKEETPLIIQTATEATLNSSTSSTAAIGSMAVNAARSAAVASAEAGSTSGVMGMGKMGAEVVSREVGAVIGGTSSRLIALFARLSFTLFDRIKHPLVPSRRRKAINNARNIPHRNYPSTYYPPTNHHNSNREHQPSNPHIYYRASSPLETSYKHLIIRQSRRKLNTRSAGHEPRSKRRDYQRGDLECRAGGFRRTVGQGVGYAQGFGC